MPKKIDDIYKDLHSYINKIENSVNDRVASAIGYTVRQRMLSLIAKGLSPILGAGRFPEYKAVSVARSLKKLNASKRAAKSSPRGYPYTAQVKRDFPNKRARPVNLFLSGDFLSNLTYAIGVRAKARLVTVGFFDDPSKKKESGHREGVNGQPKRPIIPAASESFSEVIKLDILKIVKDAIKLAARR